MKTKKIDSVKVSSFSRSLPVLLIFLICTGGKVYTQVSSSDLAKYTPAWIKDGFVDAGATHEPWLFQVRRGGEGPWRKEAYDNQMSEEFIKSLSESGITVYHVSFYKGFGFKAEKENMDNVAKAAAIAHKYGMKVDTYIQWNTMAYETFFTEVPAAKKDLWYQIDVNGKPIMLTYGFQQSFRYRPCFNNDAYMNYYKEKILRYAVEVAKTDFIHFDNFDYNNPADADHNPATITAFRKYIRDKYTQSKLVERFGYDDIANVLPPMWNDSNPAGKVVEINDPLLQEWIDFRCWTLITRLAECARFVRGLNKEVAIECNPHGLVGSNRAWEAGINHPDLMQYTNAIWTEDRSNPRWEDGVAIGQFRHYKLGRTTNNFILTYNRTAEDCAENLALNRTPAFVSGVGRSGPTKDYLDFWLANKDLYTNMQGAEKVAVLRSYPSMAYNTFGTQIAVNMAEQALQQRQIPFDIIFDQQIKQLDKYYVIVLANQESLTDEVIAALKAFAKKGGGLVVTDNTGSYDGWRRQRKQGMLEEMMSEQGLALPARNELPSRSRSESRNVSTFIYGAGRVICLPELEKPEVTVTLGYSGKRWVMPLNANELESAVYWAAGKRLPLEVIAPEWVGVSHDTRGNRDVIHLFNYNIARDMAGITIRYDGIVKNAWAISPEEKDKSTLQVFEKGGISELRIPTFKVYKVIVLEK
jgi:hypothetical protein